VKRRDLLGAGFLGAGSTALPGCGRAPAGAASARPIEMRWVGAEHARGHRLRDAGTPALAQSAWPAPARRVGVLVIGAGVAGLAAARAFMRQGVDEVHVLELEDAAGGNARAHVMAGIACPLGAHYLPVPGPSAREVAEWLHELGLLRTDAAGRTVPEERHLCHSPQERLFFEGQWVEGLLPPAAPGSPRMAQYQRFAARVTALQRSGGGRGAAGGMSALKLQAFALPAHRSAWNPETAALDGLTFAAWLGREGLDDPALRTYLDYCCRDDYGAGAATVSAWAGVHYFASRHGFAAPGDGEHEGARDAVFTWPEGNAWLTQRLAAPLGADRLHTGQVVLGVREERHRVTVLAHDQRSGEARTWEAGLVVMAVPLFVARRLVSPASAAIRSALHSAAAALTQAPWLVANLHLDRPLLDRTSGAAPAWDNVIHGSRGLGYVDATHQSLSPVAGATVLTAYQTLEASDRATLLADDPRPFGERVLAELEPAHPDLRQRVQRIDLMRYGHAMAVPRPGLQRHPALTALRAVRGRLRFAHSDLAGYSVFEEAFIAGSEVARPAPPGAPGA
jgi:predicted NAD/FAD-dependent oxidoreductase